MMTTHIIDTADGGPAAGMAVILEVHRGSDWARLASGLSDERGRFMALDEAIPLGPGVYRLTFDTGSYHRGRKLTPFFPEVQIVFTVREAGQHVHVPLLLSPFGYSTCRG